SGGNQWLAMGFATLPITNNFYAAVNCGAGFILIRGNGSGIQTFRTPGGSSTATINASFGTTTNVFTVVLNTATNGTTAINADYGWVYTFYTNGVQVDSYRVPYGNPPIQYVGIGCDAATGYFQQFTLTDVLMFPGAPVISEQPNNRMAQVGQRATFWVGVTNDSPRASYQWMTNGPSGPTNAIVGATNAIYTTPALDMSYNGLNYSVQVTNAYGATNSALASLTVASGPPAVYSATKTANTTNIVVAFSKTVDPVTGLNPANYSLNINGAPSGVSVLSASYGSVSNSVILTTSTLNTSAGYYLSVQNVKDLFGNAMSGSTTVPVLPNGLVFFARGDSGVVLDGSGNVVQWLDQTTNGNDASQFFGVPSAGRPGPAVRPAVDTFNNLQPTLDFGNGTGGNNLHWLQAPSSPSLTTLASNTTMYAVVQFAAVSPANEIVNKTWGNLPAPFDWAPGSGETVQYGNGYNNAPASGTGGTLLVGAPDVLASMISLPPSGGTTNFVFFLNGNTNGSGAIRGVTGNPAGIYDGGRPLWIGGRWDLVNGNMKGQIAEVMLFNNNLSGPDRTNVDNYLGQKYFPFAISRNLPATLTSSNGFSVTYTFGATVGSTHGLSLQWQENGTNIPGATGSSFTTPLLGPSDNGDQFEVLVTLPNGSTTNSATSTLTVLTEPPYVVTAGIPIWNTNEVVVIFDEAVDPTTATVAGNYALNNGATVLSAAIGDAPNKVILATSPLTWNANPGFYSLTVQNVKDLYGNTMSAASPSLGLYPPAVLWVKAKNGITPDGSGGVAVWNDLSGNGNSLNGFGGSTDPVLATNNFGDVVVRFTGTNDTQMYALDAPSLEITGDMSVFSVMNFARLDGGTNGDIVSKTGSVNFNIAAPYDYYVGNPTNVLFYRGNGGSSGNGVSYGNYTSSNGPSIGVPHIVGVTETGNTVSDYIDDNGAGAGPLSNGYNETSDADQGVSVLIGARGDNHNRLTGDIAEMIIMNSGMSSNDVTMLDNYLAASHRLPIGTNSYAVITQQPVASTNIDFNTTLTVPAGVSGNPLALQWYDTNGVAIAGQTSATLTINNDQTSDAYYLVATNTFGSVTSSIVSVTVISGLQVGLGSSVTLYAGQPWTFTAQAYGNVPLYYQWYQGASPIPNATNSTYSTVASLGTTSYSCTVTNGYNGYTSTNAGPVTLTGIAQPTNGFSQAILSDHPIAYWRLNEPSGSAIAYDYVGGYNGTYGSDTTNGLPGVPFAGASGELGVAMDSSDSSSNAIGHITTPGINLITNSVTLVSWVYSFANQVNPSGLIFLRDSNNANVFGSQVGGGQNFDYTWANNPATYNYGSGLVVPANIWALTALAITPSNATLYCFDSQASGSAVNNVTNAVQSFASGFALGADAQAITSNRTFNGKMDEVAIFNYTLSASQLQQLYTAATTVPVTVNPNPTNIVFSVANNQLTLSWPADHIGWQLQAQTNSTSVGIGTNWVNYNPSTGTNQVSIPINLTNGTVFFRLIYTP
ncbi:MAG TPA: LamG-like jellyroll fold domain-containing protein, partial [Verrucomicrobiae bacterium]|nr:LamG-like jellyroll fold domain-containing protein [Verrucomicrobiae bacterium]